MTQKCWVRGSWVLAIAVLMGPAACGASSPSPKAADETPTLDEPSDPSQGVPVSSAAVQRGMDAIQAGEFASAVEALEQARSDDPKDPQAAFYLGVALEGVEEYERAAALYEEASKLDPRLAEAYINWSALLLAEGQAEAAVAVVDKGLKAAAQHPDLMTNRALALESAGRNGEALEAYADAVQAAPDNAELRFNYADLLARSEHPERAKAQLKQIVQLSADAKVLAATAHVLGSLGAFGDCVAAFDRAITIEAHPALYTRRGICRHELHDEAGAKADFSKALELDAGWAPAHYYLGKHFEANGDKASACSHLKKAAGSGEGGVGVQANKALEGLRCP